MDRLVAILNQEFGLMDKVHTWRNDLQTLQSIEGQRHHMLMEVYTTKELDKTSDWIEKIVDGNKVMEKLHAYILKLKYQNQGKILEAQRHYNDTCLDNFQDDSREKLLLVEIVVE